MSLETSPSHLALGSEPSSINRLRPYQRDVALAILDSVFQRRGLTFSVEMARQGGKNELSAQLELLLLALYMAEPQNIIKCSPTFKPQTVISMMRLKDRLNDVGFGGLWVAELGYIIRLGNARVVFLSADESANVVGNTAHLLLEIDEAQDVSKEKYTKEFKPMGAVWLDIASITVTFTGLGLAVLMILFLFVIATRYRQGQPIPAWAESLVATND